MAGGGRVTIGMQRGGGRGAWGGTADGVEVAEGADLTYTGNEREKHVEGKQRKD